MKPRVTVVMPVRNEARYIERSLGSVLAQDYPSELLEVLVADGMSSDGTRELIARIRGGRDVRILDNPRGIVAPGLNIAVAEARGEVIVRVDGHCEVAPDYVTRAVDYLRRDDVAGVSGPITTVGETPVARVIAAGMSSRFGVGDSAFRIGSTEARFVDTIAFPAYRRDVVEEAGPFDEELVRNQDDEYNFRLRGAGKKLLLAPDLAARYYSRAGLRSLWRQYFQYGFWKIRVLQKHPRQMSARQFVPPLFVAALVAAALAMPWIGAIGLAAIAGPYLGANLLASAVEARRAGWPGALLLPIVFAVLHVAYGSGFLVGLGRFAHRWYPFRDDG